LFLAVAPAVAMNLFAGQNGFFTATFLILAVRHMDRKPIVAGICLGLLTVKPQLAILFPLALLLSGRIRCFASAALTTLLLIALSCAVFGTGVWVDYLRLAIPFQNEVMNYGTGIFIPMMPTSFMNARLWDASPVVAWLVQAPFSLLAIAAVVWTFGRRRDPLLSFAVRVRLADRGPASASLRHLGCAAGLGGLDIARHNHLVRPLPRSGFGADPGSLHAAAGLAVAERCVPSRPL
jgi:hypothetical protein